MHHACAYMGITKKFIIDIRKHSRQTGCQLTTIPNVALWLKGPCKESIQFEYIMKITCEILGSNTHDSSLKLYKQ